MYKSILYLHNFATNLNTFCLPFVLPSDFKASPSVELGRNFFDSPFTTCTAVIDSDNYYHTRVGQYPFFIKKDFVNFAC